MELTFSIDTNDLYGEGGAGLEHLISDSLKREIIKNSKDSIASDKFAEFSRLTSDTIIAEIKLKMEKFLTEEIVLTEKWGKPTFVGSIEDLIKQRFDDILIRPVDGNGKTLQGCTTGGDTWIEWKIGESLKKRVEKIVADASKSIESAVVQTVKQKIIEIKDTALKKEVDSAFLSILNRK